MPKEVQWQYTGNPQFASGTSRGTTTSSGVMGVSVAWSSLQRGILFSMAWDEAIGTRVTATGGGPYQTQATFYDFQPLSPSGLTARFRVRQNRVSAGGTQSTMTLATSTTAVRFRYFCIGW